VNFALSVEATLSSEYIAKGMLTLDHIVTADGLTIARPHQILTKRMIELIERHSVSTVKVKFDPEIFPKAAEIYRLKADAEKKPVPISLPEIDPVINDELRVEAIGSIKKMFDVFGKSGEAGTSMTTAHLAVKEVDLVVDRLIEALSDETYSLVHIEGLRSYDEYTYHHSLSVAVLAIAIGQSIGFSDKELRLLGRAAMMHDIGKVNTPLELINKPGKLTDSEFKTVKNHASDGYKYLALEEVGDENFRKAVLCHHERLDGSGYPNKLSGDDIPFMSRIIAVADVYDAVTSYRSYRKPMSPSDAMELVMSEVGRAFDYNVVIAFIKKIDFYPLNTCVELSNGKLGVVIDNSHTLRPILRMLESGDIVDLMNMNNLRLIITGIVDNEKTED